MAVKVEKAPSLTLVDQAVKEFGYRTYQAAKRARSRVSFAQHTADLENLIEAAKEHGISEEVIALMADGADALNKAGNKLDGSSETRCDWLALNEGHFCKAPAVGVYVGVGGRQPVCEKHRDWLRREWGITVRPLDEGSES